MADLAKLEQTRQRALDKQRGNALFVLRRAAGSGSSAAKLYMNAVEANGQPDFAD